MQIALIIYLGIYAFNNPDNEAWYGTDSKHNGQLFAREADALSAQATEVVDIHAKFVLWFRWGFFMIISMFLSHIVIFAISSFHKMAGETIRGLLVYGFSCALLAWWVCGIIWRFNSRGSFSAGDSLQKAEREAEQESAATLYQLRSGRFMLIYYIITWSLIGFAVFFSFVCLVFVCLSLGENGGGEHEGSSDHRTNTQAAPVAYRNS